MSIADIPQLQNLTDEEKLQLIDELWDSLEFAPPPGISEEEKRILDERLAEHEANPGTSLTLEEFKRRWAERHPEAPIGDGL
jgi:putative addiction module component (TIGR02574 family)